VRHIDLESVRLPARALIGKDGDKKIIIEGAATGAAVQPDAG
jgi:hypothetical protein